MGGVVGNPKKTISGAGGGHRLGTSPAASLSYVDHFGLSAAELRAVLDEALSSGA